MADIHEAGIFCVYVRLCGFTVRSENSTANAPRLDWHGGCSRKGKRQFASKTVKRSLSALAFFLLLFANVHLSAAARISFPSRSCSSRSWPARPEQIVGTRGPARGIRVFRGTITRDGDRCVLREAAGGSWYELDDQQTAAKFVDKPVVVTGTLDKVRHLIRMQSIERATAKIAIGYFKGAAWLALFPAEGPESNQRLIVDIE
jgi:Protein of unknown function (DUF5818)